MSDEMQGNPQEPTPTGPQESQPSGPGPDEMQGTPQEPTSTGPQEPQQTAGPSQDEKTMGMLAHLLGLLYIIGPLVIWLIKKDESNYVGEQAKEALNFQITVLIALVISSVLSFVGIGCVLFFVVQVFWLVFVIMATIQANQGVMYKYPVTLRLIK